MFDRMKHFFRSHWFDAHHKLTLHILQLVLIVIIICFAGARIATKPKSQPVTRSDTLAIVMAIKSIVFLAYQLVTEHSYRFKKWGSLKAYAILNSMEIVFYFVVAVLGFMGISMYCKGASCAFGWLVILIAVMLMAFAFWTAVIAWRDHRYFKKFGTKRGTALPTTRQNAYQSDSSSAQQK